MFQSHSSSCRPQSGYSFHRTASCYHIASVCVSSPDQRRPPQVWEHGRASGRHSTPSNAGSGQRVLNYGSGGKFKKLESYIAVGVLLAP